MSDGDEYSDDQGSIEYSEDEYNSEDDEFLAFHDAEIEAQVRAEMQKMNKRFFFVFSRRLRSRNLV